MSSLFAEPLQRPLSTKNDFDYMMALMQLVPPEYRMYREEVEEDSTNTSFAKQTSARHLKRFAKKVGIPTEEVFQNEGKKQQTVNKKKQKVKDGKTQRTKIVEEENNASSDMDLENEESEDTTAESSTFTFGSLHTDNTTPTHVDAKMAAQEAKRRMEQVPKSIKLARLRELETEMENLNPEARRTVEETIRRENAARRARGERPLETSKTLKKKVDAKRRKKAKSAKQWEERKERLENKRQRRAERRAENVENARLGLRGRRPGFEGKLTQPLNKRGGRAPQRKPGKNNTSNNNKGSKK